MYKKINIFLLCSSALLAANSFAATEEVVNESSSDFIPWYLELPSNEVKTIKNHLIWKRHRECEVRMTQNEVVDLYIQALKKRSVINGIVLDEGAATTFIVKPGSILDIEFYSRAHVGFTNLGKSLISLKCK
ncbi:hypothetical protein ACFORL_12670 [Legionella dresdenensis]|uniref:Uncharacterized protein n=1 Tax=Legionella dresdenensis TaxID=450200 RepID=A0ABV8CIK7_9GAMM